MLRFGFVLLLATSVIAAPASSYENVNLILTENEGVSSNNPFDRLFGYLDGGDVNVHTLTLQELLKDLSSKPNSYAKALALGQAVTSMLALSTGIPGDTCIAAALLQAYPTRNYHQALVNYVNHISKNLYLINKLANSKQSLRFESGPTSNCQAGGRVYDFESVWDSILDNAPQSLNGILSEQYSTVKRLYCAFNVQSNNVAAVTSASSLPPMGTIFEKSYNQLLNYLVAVAENRNVDSALALARQSLAKAIPRS